MIRLGEDLGKHRQEATPASDVRLRLVRGGSGAEGAGGGGPRQAPVTGAGGSAGTGGGTSGSGGSAPAGERSRVIDLRRARARGHELPPDGDEPKEERIDPDWKDILALIIATFEVLGPFLLMLFGAAGLVYLFLRLVAH